MCILALGRLGEEAQSRLQYASNITTTIGRNDAEQILPRLLRQVGLLEDALGRVNVWQVECGTGVARIEDGCKAYARLQWAHQDSMHLVVGDVSDLAEIDRVDDLVVAVILIAI